MLINSRCVAGTPSRRVTDAPSRRVAAPAPRRLAGFGREAIVRERGLAGPAADGGYLAGIWAGGGNAAAGYLPDPEGSFRLGQRALQVGKAQGCAGTKVTVDNSNDQHKSIQMALLIPANRGEVGPQRVREPGPA